MTDTSQKVFDLNHRRCWDALPWLVNGSLNDDEAVRVAAHVAGCAECAKELEAQRALHRQLQAREGVVMAPQGSLQKMMLRLDADDEQIARGRASGGTLRWVVAAQTVLIVGLIVAVWSRWNINEQNLPRYSTLSAESTSIPKDAVRVVFNRDLSLSDMNALLHSVHAEIVAGPSEAGVFTVHPNGVEANSAQLLDSLRKDSRVIFAEPTNAIAAATQTQSATRN